MIKEFYNRQDCYEKAKFISYPLKKLLGDGMITSEGETWKYHRRLISSIFHYEFLKSQIPIISTTTTEFLADISDTSLKRIRIMEKYQQITGEIVGRIFFGNKLNEYKMDGKLLTITLAKLFTELSMKRRGYLRFFLGDELFWKTPSMADLDRRITKFRGICEAIIQERKKNLLTKPRNSDLLDLLLEAQRQGEKIFDKEIVDEFISFFLAGMDTTAHLVTMMTYHLFHSVPQYVEKVQEESSKYFINKSPEELKMEDLNNMEMLQLIIKETLRLHTPVIGVFPREATKSHYLGKVHVKKGTDVQFGWVINNSNSKYHEDPDKFNPERWVDKNSQTLKSVGDDPFVFIPFSAGARNCMGQHLAQIQAKIIICEMLKTFRVKISEGYVNKMTFRGLHEPHYPLILDLERIHQQ